MWETSLGDPRRALESGAALGNIWNANGQMAANRNLPEERFDCAHFRNRSVGKGTHVILDLGKIAGQIRIPHGDDRCFFRSMIEQLLQQRASRIRYVDRIACSPRRSYHT